MAYDVFHQTVRHALIADGWIITHDPLIIPFGDTKLYVDFGAERLLAAEKPTNCKRCDSQAGAFPTLLW